MCSSDLGMADVFGDGIRTYASDTELVDLLQADPNTAFPDRTSRLAMAERIAREHSFDARAAVLVERAMELRGAP